MDNLFIKTKEFGKDIWSVARRTPILLTFPLVTAFAPLKKDNSQINEQPQEQIETYDNKYWDVSPEDVKHIYNQGLSKAMTGEEAILNPFLQPNQEDKNWQGSGDADGDNDVDYDDISAMQLGADNYASDVDGDGVASTENDQAVLQSYLDGSIKHLPGAWDELETREERLSWLEKMLAIDQTDKEIWVNGTVDDRWISGNYAAQVSLNFFGYSGTDIPAKYNQGEVERHNMPVYWANVWDPDTGIGHGMNFILIGDNPLDFNDWCPIEPQNDTFNFKPGETFSIPFNRKAFIAGFTNFRTDMPEGISIVGFYVDENGGVDQIYKREGLVLERPPLAISNRNTLPENYILRQNHPNPFNNSTSIEYNLPVREHIKLDIYDIRGKQVKTLVDEVQGPGEYRTGWDGISKEGNSLASGVYLYGLQTDKGASNTMRMILLK